MNDTKRWATIVATLMLAACFVGEKNECRTQSDCLAGHVCSDSKCRLAGQDAGVVTDAGTFIVDGGNAGTLSGAMAFDVGTAFSTVYTWDGGMSQVQIAMASRVLTGDVCTATSGNGPLKSFLMKLYRRNGEPRTGLYTFGNSDGNSSTYRHFDGTNQVTVEGALISGTADIVEFGTRSRGTFTGTLILADGGTSALAGQWDTPVCTVGP